MSEIENIRPVEMPTYPANKLDEPAKPIRLVTVEDFEALKEEVRVLTEIVYRFLYRQEMSAIFSEMKIDENYKIPEGINELFAKTKKIP